MEGSYILAPFLCEGVDALGLVDGTRGGKDYSGVWIFLKQVPCAEAVCVYELSWGFLAKRNRAFSRQMENMGVVSIW